MSNIKLETFITELTKRLEKNSAKNIEINYERPNDISPLESWMKEQLDIIGIEKINFNYVKHKGITTSNIIYLVESPEWRPS